MSVIVIPRKEKYRFPQNYSMKETKIEITRPIHRSFGLLGGASFVIKKAILFTDNNKI